MKSILSLLIVAAAIVLAAPFLERGLQEAGKRAQHAAQMAETTSADTASATADAETSGAIVYNDTTVVELPDTILHPTVEDVLSAFVADSSVVYATLQTDSLTETVRDLFVAGSLKWVFIKSRQVATFEPLPNGSAKLHLPDGRTQFLHATDSLRADNIRFQLIVWN